VSTFQVREEVLNVVLADLLSRHGLLSIPESIRRSVAGRGRKLPDVTVADLRGVRIVIEGRIGDGGIRDSLFRDACERVEQGLSPICLAVLYPASLRTVDSLVGLRRALERADLLVRVVSERDEGDWVKTTVDGLTAILRRSYELLVSEDVVAAAVDSLNEAIESASQIISSSPATPARVRSLLGIPEEPAAQEQDEDEGD
jgi:hypothetical protein